MRTGLLLLCLLGAGLLGGLGARMLGTGEDRLLTRPDDQARIEARLSDLIARVQGIEDEIDRARSLPGWLDVREAPATAAPPAATGSTLPLPEPGPVMIPEARIEEKVRATVEEIVREERETRERNAAAVQAEQEAAWLGKIREPLNLTDEQVAVLADLLARRRTGIAAYKRKLAELGAVPDEAQKALLDQEVADLGRELDACLRSILSSTQYDALMKRPAAAK